MSNDQTPPVISPSSASMSAVVIGLAERAAKAAPIEAMQLSQAALNVAHAYNSLWLINRT